MIKGVTHAHLGPIWYRSEPSDVPYLPNQFLGWDFFCRFLQQDGSRGAPYLPEKSLSMLPNKVPSKNFVKLQSFFLKIAQNLTTVSYKGVSYTRAVLL